MRKLIPVICILFILLMSTACSDKDTVINPPIEENDKDKDEKPDEPKEPEPEEPGDIIPTYEQIGKGDWSDVPVPVPTPKGYEWQVQENVSDDFNYEFSPVDIKTIFNEKWVNFYHSNWNGPGITYWQYDHVSVDGNNLVIKASRNPSTEKMDRPGVNTACITSANQVIYPAYIEARVSVANIALASDVWMLSTDATQEIDIVECYAGSDHGMDSFSEFIHMSHHTFIRKPFTDYQPRDKNSHWKKPGVKSWGEYCWNNGDREYIRVGVYWAGPKHFEYYAEGKLIRVLYENALANKIDGVWEYAYPTMTNGEVDMEWGKQKITPYKTSDSYSFELLKEASDFSTTSIIDPYKYLGEDGFVQPLTIIVNMEAQEWHVNAERIPDDGDLANPNKNRMLVDWIRVCKPVKISEE